MMMGAKCALSIRVSRHTPHTPYTFAYSYAVLVCVQQMQSMFRLIPLNKLLMGSFAADSSFP